MAGDVVKRPYNKEYRSRGEEYKEKVLEKESIPNQKIVTKVYRERQERERTFTKEKSDLNLEKIAQRVARDTSELEPLKTIGRRITGNLFDRVKFLQQRIEELRLAIESREQLHRRLMGEMEIDIKDREKMLERVTDSDDLRQHKLDISILKMEKRKEEMLHWRDIVTLRKELQEMREEYENELKVVNLFTELNLPK